MNELASRYALALLSISEENKLTNEFQQQIKEIISLLNENPKFIDVLNSSFLSKEERKNIVSKTFKGFDKNIVNMINLLLDNNRINFLLEICYEFNSLVNEKRGVKEGFVYSTEYLSKDLLDKICKTISEIEHTDIELKNLIDSKLIGGVKVVIGNHVYDGSIKNKLNELKTNLINKEGE